MERKNGVNIFLLQKKWISIFRLPFTITSDSKFQWLQYRINHFILTTNNFMYKIGNIDTNLCTFCENAEETIYHLLWECPKVQHLLAEYVRVCNSKGSELE